MKRFLTLTAILALPLLASANPPVGRGQCPPVVSRAQSFQFQSFNTFQPSFQTFSQFQAVPVQQFGFNAAFAVGAPPILFANSFSPVFVPVQQRARFSANVNINARSRGGIFGGGNRGQQVIRQKTTIRSR